MQVQVYPTGTTLPLSYASGTIVALAARTCVSTLIIANCPKDIVPVGY